MDIDGGLFHHLRELVDAVFGLINERLALAGDYGGHGGKDAAEDNDEAEQGAHRRKRARESLTAQPRADGVEHRGDEDGEQDRQQAYPNELEQVAGQR